MTRDIPTLPPTLTIDGTTYDLAHAVIIGAKESKPPIWQIRLATGEVIEARDEVVRGTGG